MNKVKCNNCEEIFNEEDIVYDGGEDTEYCPKCRETGCLKDLTEDEYFEWLLNEIEKLDWIVEDEKDGDYRLSKYSPMGQDFGIDIHYDGNTKAFIQKIHKCWERYDVSYETYLCLDLFGHGLRGAPYEMEDILEDMKWCKSQILELHTDLIKLI